MPGRKTESGLSLIAVVRKIRASQTMGLECPSPGIGVFHSTLCPVAEFHWIGGFCLSAIPEAPGPRNDGHWKRCAVSRLATEAEATSRRAQHEKKNGARRMAERSGDEGVRSGWSIARGRGRRGSVRADAGAGMRDRSGRSARRFP